MIHSRRRLLFVFIFLLCASIFTLLGQAPPPTTAPTQDSSEHKNPAISTTARLTGARTVFIRRPHGNEIPFQAISVDFDGWGRYVMVNDESKADLVVEITAPEESSGFSVSSTTSSNTPMGKPEQSTTSRKDFSNAPVRMVVLDAKSKTPLWMGSEQPKSALRRKGQEDNQVEAAHKLFSRFHDRVEPPLK
jgi:hypothetical protein